MTESVSNVGRAILPADPLSSGSLEIGHLRHKELASDFAGLFLPDALPYFWRLSNHAAAARERTIWERPFRSAGACSPPANWIWCARSSPIFPDSARLSWPTPSASYWSGVVPTGN